ncbi:MAG: hypothetical protein A4E45_00609 [Methanosaeta sp. PtaB.Bin039]|nr:MAG: hypothetical protein A4E45_00609 [Methanosaeta sp. PtaB.Bin039]HQF17460.1 formylmethanofuran dehydrogenase subunit B [Methanotrichaceae archaeon]HQI92046.1 formylmethanofuran dehydrogenase subunit B [Methanotrichaceae archaeon]
MAVCTGCSLLCDDIEVTLESGRIARTKNLCRKGLGRFRSLYSERASPRADGSEVDVGDAISRAAEILSGAKRPLLFGWSNSTLEAQQAGIALARKLGGVIDDTSSFCQGPLMELVIRGQMPTGTLDDVRNFGDTLIYWGSDPTSSHPRHMSRFSYFPRGEKLQKGFEEDRTAFAVDVRESPTAKIVADGYFQIPPGGDAEFIEAILSVLDGKMPKVQDKKRMISFVTTLKKAKMGFIFPGLGLVYSLKDRLDLFSQLVARLNEGVPFRVIPMVGHYNMRGFNQTLFEQTGGINQVSFADGEARRGQENGIISALDSCDAALVVGSDPVSSLPAAFARKLAKIPVVVMDPHRNLTADLARVVIPTALSGLEAGGAALRMDGVRVELAPVVEGASPSDAEVLARIREVV